MFIAIRIVSCFCTSVSRCTLYVFCAAFMCNKRWWW